MICWVCPQPKSRESRWSGLGAVDLGYSSFCGPGQWEGVPSSCVHSCGACMLASGGVFLITPAPHGSLVAMWAEIPFLSTSGIFQKEQCQGTQENKRADHPRHC